MATGVSRDKEASSTNSPVLGIDFGTSKMCAAIYRNDQVYVVTNEYEERLTPCYVEFAKERCNIGESAQKNASKNPKNTVYGIKRLMGRRYSEFDLQSYDRCAISIKKKNGRPQIQVQDEKMKFGAEEISAMIIGKIKSRAEMQYGTTFQQVVIAVPAQFNNAQRKSTKNAGRIVGFEKVFLINEPTAAALAYEMGRENDAEQTILVFDLGAGCFDVSVCKVSQRDVCVIATRGDSNFGGDDFDNKMLHHFAKVIKQKHGIDIYQDEKARNRLCSECEKAKIQLSESTNAEIQVEFFAENAEFKYVVNRDQFDKINDDFFLKIETNVLGVLDDAHLSSDKIDEVVVVGGSFRISRVEEFLNHIFKKVNRTLNTDEAVVNGAAIYADHIRQIQQKRANPSKTRQVTRKITDVATRSLFVVAGNKQPIVIQRNAKLMGDGYLKKSLNGTSTDKYWFWRSFSLISFGSRREFLAEFELREQTSNGEESILGNLSAKNLDNFLIKIGVNGMFIFEKSKEEAGHFVYTTTASGEPTPEEMEKMIANTKKVDKKYGDLREKREAKNEFEKTIYKGKETVKTSEYQNDISSEQTELILQKCDEGIKWLENSKDVTANQYKEKKKELEGFIDDIFTSTLRKKQFEEERNRRKARHDLQTLIFEITEKMTDKDELYQKCLEIETFIESQKIKTREEYEHYRRELKKKWNESGILPNETAMTQILEQMKGFAEIGKIMLAISEVAARYKLTQSTIHKLVCTYQAAWAWMSEKSEREPVNKWDKLESIMRQIEESTKQLPKQQHDDLIHVHGATWTELKSILKKEDSEHN